MLPVLRIAAVGETRLADVAERIADDLKLTPGERDELLPSGRQRVLHRVSGRGESSGALGGV